MTDLAGKKIAGNGFGNLVAYEIQFLIDRYKLGSKTTIVSAASLAATAGLHVDLPAATIFDFSLSTAAAKELSAVRSK